MLSTKHGTNMTQLETTLKSNGTATRVAAVVPRSNRMRPGRGFVRTRNRSTGKLTRASPSLYAEGTSDLTGPSGSDDATITLAFPGTGCEPIVLGSKHTRGYRRKAREASQHNGLPSDGSRTRAPASSS